VEAVWLALGASFFWGASDYGAGVMARRVSVFAVSGGMLAAGALAALPLPLILGTGMPPLRTVLLGVAAGTMTVLGLTSLYQALATGRMAVVAPISATGVAVPILVGMLGGDAVSATQVAGMVIGFVGMVALVMLTTESAAERRSSGRKPIVLAGVAAVGLGLYYVAVGGIAEGETPWFVVVGQTTAALVLGCIVLIRRVRLPSRADGLQIGALGIVGFLAWVMAALALSQGALSVTATLTSLYPVVTTAMAVVVARERLNMAQVGALAVTFVGVGLMASG
jgi:drug/metabolite transporter (DMT)-like permease